MKITLERITEERFPEPGARWINVDGVRWGRVVVTGHGCHGKSYRFRQAGGEIIEAIRKGHTTPRPVEIQSEGKRWNGSSLQKPEPIQTRLIAKIAEMIDGGYLKHPDQYRKDMEELRAKFTARQEEADREAEAKLRARATEVVAAWEPDHGRAALIGAIVHAMKWAQTK